MSALLALYLRDLKLAVRVGGGAMVGVIFFLTILVVVPFAIGPDLDLIARLGPAILWIGALLATLLGLDRLFEADREDGALDLMATGGQPLELVVLVKAAAHWTATGVPLLVATPVMSLLVDMPPAVLGATLATLLVGTPALTLIGTIGAALTVSLRRGGLLLPVIVLPFAVPILIFGVAAAGAPASSLASFASPFLFLAAASLVMLVVAPVAAAAALRGGLE